MRSIEKKMRILHRSSIAKSTDRDVLETVRAGRSTIEMRKLKSFRVLVMLGIVFTVKAPMSTDTMTLDAAMNVATNIVPEKKKE